MQKATASLWLRNPDQEFAKHMKYVTNLSEKLAALERAGSKLQEERNGKCIICILHCMTGSVQCILCITYVSPSQHCNEMIMAILD